MQKDVPGQVKPYLDEIANRLWSNNAVVMVGAGFSRNAKSVNATSDSFPVWKDLGEKYYKKLHGHTPSESDAQYLDLLKLAEQVDAAFGRPALNDLLRQAIPDLNYEPSQLHRQLLSLPWKDIFTTNYDTLLERTRVHLTLKHYDVVITKEDLLYADNPRIVKLHGSLPFPSSLVVTEEDYRKFPNKHAPFVNTVRQALLENTLCLIGFSGDDPNFLQWIGWMRDHLGEKTSPKIYLIGVFKSLSDVKKKLFDSRGIVTVDLTELNTNQGTALSEFLKYLKCRKSLATKWPIITENEKSLAMNVTSDNCADIAAEWRRQRNNYPGWVVMPENSCRDLWSYTRNCLDHLFQMSQTDRIGLKTPLDLNLAYELAWRLDRCLVPLIGEIPKFLEEVVEKYRSTRQLPDNIGWTEISMFEAIANIQLWLLRHYREEGMDEKWKQIRCAIKIDDKRLLPEHRVKFQLEDALRAFFSFDPVKAKRLLVVEWRSEEFLPFWEAKRAILMAELGETTTALSILEKSLLTIRQQLSLNPVTDDYTLVSQESVVMLMRWTLERGLAVENLELGDRNFLDELSERWNELARFKCDPRRAITSLSAQFQRPLVGRIQQIKNDFDLGKASTTHKFGLDEEQVAVYRLLRMYEAFGMPYRIANATFFKTSIESALPCLRLYSPHWALVNIVRLGDTNIPDVMFNREYLDGLGRDEVDRLFEIYLPAFEHTIFVVNEPDLSAAKNIEMLAKTLPEVFSRLCYKCSTTYRERLVNILRDIYESNQPQMFANVRDFAIRLFDSMSVRERVRAIPLLIGFPVPKHLDELNERDFINPMQLLVNLPETVGGDAIIVEQLQIDEVFDRLTHNSLVRARALTSLVWLHKHKNLNEQQSKRLGVELWACVENSGVPVVPGYCRWACITMPYPKEIEPERRVKQHLRTMISETIGDSRLNEILDELYNSAELVKWSEAEVLELVQILSKWWFRNKVELNDYTPMPFVGIPAENTKRIIRKVIRALAALFSHLPETTYDDIDIDSLRVLLMDLTKHEIPAMFLEAAILNIVKESPDELIDRVKVAMVDNNHDVVVDALSAAVVLIRTFSEKNARCKVAPVVNRLLQGIQWRSRPALVDRLRAVEYLVNKKFQFLSVGVEAESGLLEGLEQIAEETSTGVRGNDQDGVIEIRAAAASLAFSLSCYYVERRQDEPEAIQCWREICNNPNEFSEIRNSWIEFDD